MKNYDFDEEKQRDKNVIEETHGRATFLLLPQLKEVSKKKKGKVISEDIPYLLVENFNLSATEDTLNLTWMNKEDAISTQKLEYNNQMKYIKSIIINIDNLQSLKLYQLRQSKVLSIGVKNNHSQMPILEQINRIKEFLDENRSIAEFQLLGFSPLVEKPVSSYLKKHGYESKENNKKEKVFSKNKELTQAEIEEMKKYKIKAYITEIKERLEYNPEKENIKNRVSELLKNYNQNIENFIICKRTQKDPSEMPDLDKLYVNLIQELDSILKKIETYHEDIAVYYEMIKTIETMRKMLKQEEGQTTKEEHYNKSIEKEFYNIITESLEIIDITEKSKIKAELMKILDKYDKEIHDYLDSSSVKTDTSVKEISYHTEEEFAASLKDDIQNTLEKLESYLDNEEIIRSMLMNIKEVIESFYRVSDYSSRYLINDSIEKVKEERKIADKIINVIIDIDDTIRNNKDCFSFYREQLNGIIENDIATLKCTDNLMEKLESIHEKLLCMKKMLKEDEELQKQKVEEDIWEEDSKSKKYE